MSKQLCEADNLSCEKFITEKEIVSAVKDLPNNKSPGSNRFPIEFYKFLWPQIKEIAVGSILYGLDHGELSLDQRQGVLSLIQKKDKDIQRLKNWHHISLLKADYKIIAKILAKRLQNVLPHIIRVDNQDT